MFTLRPLTAAERTVAERHAGMVDRFLARNKLPADDWYDVVVFGYLLAVEKWFRRPELYVYAFSTIAWQTMRSTVGNERRKQERRIKTISLDDLIPGSDDITYADIITEKNLDFIPYI